MDVAINRIRLLPVIVTGSVANRIHGTRSALNRPEPVRLFDSAGQKTSGHFQCLKQGHQSISRIWETSQWAEL